jgi:hypothetical protein
MLYEIVCSMLYEIVWLVGWLIIEHATINPFLLGNSLPGCTYKLRPGELVV